MLRRDDDRGFVMVAAIGVLALMLVLGAGILSVVDTQTKASGTQRDGDASFNLAESTLSSAAFVLARNWPSSSSAQAWSATPCSAEAISGGVARTSATTFAGQVQDMVAQTSAARSGPADATWKVNVCAEPTGTNAVYSDAAALPQAGYDTGTRRLWVRAQATVNGRRSAVAAMVALNGVTAAVPTAYAMLAGRFTLSSGASQVVSDLLTGSTLGPFVDMLLGKNGQEKLVESNGAMIGVRCGLVTNPCLEALEAGLTQVPLLSNTLGTQKVVQVAGRTAASPATVRALRSYAAANGWYVPSVADGQPCIPSTLTAPTDATKWMVFVEKVGNGDGTCTLSADGSQHAGVIVGSGRMKVTGSNYFMGVVYGLNLQSASDGKVRQIVTVSQGAKVKGDVLVDLNGTVSLYPPTVNLCSLTGIGSVVSCVTTGVASVAGALPGTSVSNLINQIAGQQMTTYGPAISYDSSIAARLQVAGTTGVQTGTFRQISPN